MDLNHLLLFIAFISPVVLIARSQRRPATHRGWRLAAIVVFVIAGIAWLIFPDEAGYIAGVAWLFLLLLPAVGIRQMYRLTAFQRFSSARHLARWLALLHPADGIPEQVRLLRAIETAQRGQIQAALDQLAPLRSNTTTTGREATAQTFAMAGDWRGLIDWYRDDVLPTGDNPDSPALNLYLQALGEVHALDDLVYEVAVHLQIISRTSCTNSISLSWLILAAFTGNSIAIVKLFQGPLRRFPKDVKTFWRATAEIAAGDIATGSARLEQLRSSSRDMLLKQRVEQRLQAAAHCAKAVSNLSETSINTLSHLKGMDPQASAPGWIQRLRSSPVVSILIGLNVLTFLIEIVLGGSQNPETLHRMGQLETATFFDSHEYWRLLTSLFLHYGILHLAFNVYALSILGPALERMIGSFRFTVCYLLSGIGAGLGVVALHVVGLTPAQELVGASGAIMGIVGTWAGLLLKNRRTPMAGRRLKSILLIVVIQTAFDLTTPQISMGAHMSGLFSGLILGLILAPRSPRAVRPG